MAMVCRPPKAREVMKEDSVVELHAASRHLHADSQTRGLIFLVYFVVYCVETMACVFGVYWMSVSFVIFSLVLHFTVFLLNYQHLAVTATRFVKMVDTIESSALKLLYTQKDAAFQRCSCRPLIRGV